MCDPVRKENGAPAKRAFRELIEIARMVDMLACATSAKRNAANGAEIAGKILIAIGISATVING